jgi:hypothetical protein
MPLFVAIKTHYDHRHALPSYLKYTRPATPDEYREYLALSETKNTGKGFHECMNFSIPEEETSAVKVYLPPTCVPGKKVLDEEFVFFSFTYKQDTELPSHIVGIHGGATVLGSEPRTRRENIRGVERLTYIAEAPANLVTLLTPPLAYDQLAGLHTRKFNQWGFGLRYLEEQFAQKIIADSSMSARRALAETMDDARRRALEREIGVLDALNDRYFTKKPSSKPARQRVFAGELPDAELGYLGEQHVFERELVYVKENGFPASVVQWISRGLPQSPYDIKTVRLGADGVRDHYLEVKSSRAQNDSNIYISSGQVEFFQTNAGCGEFVFVQFDAAKRVLSDRRLTLAEVEREFALMPIKYKLRRI